MDLHKDFNSLKLTKYFDMFFYDDKLYITNIMENDTIYDLDFNIIDKNPSSRFILSLNFLDNYQEERLNFMNKDNLIFLMSYQEN